MRLLGLSELIEIGSFSLKKRGLSLNFPLISLLNFPYTQHARLLAALRTACERCQGSHHQKTHALAVELLNDWEAIFQVLSHPELPLTNNEAEVRFVDPKPSSTRTWGMGPEPQGGNHQWLENLIPV